MLVDSSRKDSGEKEVLKGKFVETFMGRGEKGGPLKLEV